MSYYKGIAFGLMLGLGLGPAPAQAQTLPVLDGAGVDADALVFHRQEPAFFNSAFSEWMNLGALRLASSSTWTPTLKNTGTESVTLRSYQESQTLYLALGTWADLKLGRYTMYSTYAFRDSAAYAAQLQSDRHGYPVGVLYHLLKQDMQGTHFDLLLDFKAVEKLEYHLGFQWSRPDVVGQSRYFSLECLHTYRDASDPFLFADLRPSGTKEQLSGTYNARYQSLSALSETRLGPGIWGASALYTWSQPKLPKGEYGFTDSSQSLKLGLQFKGTRKLPSLWYAYTEGRTRTSGIRVPPGSEGSKRFHYALSSHTLQELRMESHRHEWIPKVSSSVGLAGSYFSLQSEPSQSAIDQHKETLSYNRLGLSFIADMYGGFSRSGELIGLNGKIEQLELVTHHELHLSTLRLLLDLPIILTYMDASMHGETHTQGLFTTSVDRVYDFGKTGRILSLTPRLKGEWQVGTLGQGKLKMGAKASQAIFLWNDVENRPGTSSNPAKPSDPPKATASTSTADYPPLSNGFLGEISMALDF